MASQQLFYTMISKAGVMHRAPVVSCVPDSQARVQRKGKFLAGLAFHIAVTPKAYRGGPTGCTLSGNPPLFATKQRCMLALNLGEPGEAQGFVRRVATLDPGIRTVVAASATRAVPTGHGYRSALAISLMLLTSGCVYSLKPSVVGACSATLDSTILNFCVVTPDVLWRGGIPDKMGAAWLMQHGVRTIVNLEMIRDDRSAFAGARIADAGKYQADYFRIHDWQPLSKWAPSLLDDKVAHFLAIVSQQPKPIYVHCLFGEDRTGVMIAAYRILIEGAETEQAIEEMGRYHAPWFAANAKYIRALVPERREKIRREMLQWIPRLKRDAHIACENDACVVSDH
jgi:hypothetical protein